MKLDTIAGNRLCLLAAFILMFLSTRADLPDGYPMHLTILEAMGATFGAAVPALIGQLWLKTPRLWHGITLGFAILMAWGMWYARTHP
jgi:hypothetical protein